MRRFFMAVSIAAPLRIFSYLFFLMTAVSAALYPVMMSAVLYPAASAVCYPRRRENGDKYQR